MTLIKFNKYVTTGPSIDAHFVLTQTAGLANEHLLSALDVDIVWASDGTRNIGSATKGALGIYIQGDLLTTTGKDGFHISRADGTQLWAISTGTLTNLYIAPNVDGQGWMGTSVAKLAGGYIKDLTVNNLVATEVIAATTIITFSANDTTPSVVGGNTFKFPAQPGAVSVTMFNDGVAGQKIDIIAGTTDTTIVDAGNLKMAGNFVCNTNDSLTLVFDGTDWTERCRSVNT